MKYITIVAFTDKFTGDVYYVGDKYPAKGKFSSPFIEERLYLRINSYKWRT